MTVTLRPDQESAVGDVRGAFAIHRRVLLQAPTGFGKTQVAAFCLKSAAAKRLRSWIVLHRDYLVEQTSLTLHSHGVDHSFIAAGRSYNPHASTFVCSMDTLVRRLQKLDHPDFIVVDEAHHSASNTWSKVLAWASRARVLGLTASPCRLDGKGLDQYFDELVNGPSVAWLMERGFLSAYRAFAPSLPNLDGVHTRAGDYALDELNTVMDDGKIIGDMVRHYQTFAAGMRALYFGVSIKHSEHIAATFNEAGIRATHIDGTSPTAIRRKAACDLASGAISVISNVSLCSEGYDLAAQAGTDVTIECVGLARPTKSLGLYLQAVGRALRPKENPAIILDHAGLLLAHGLPDDDRQWSLKGIDKRKAASRDGPAVTQCGSCFGVYRAGLMACPYCGIGRVMQAREVEEVAGNLIEVRRAEIRAGDEERKQRERAEQEAARTTAELIQLGRKRGYKNPGWWAIKIMKSREGHVSARALAKATGVHPATIDYHLKNGNAPRMDMEQAKQWALQFKESRESKISLRELGRRIDMDGGIVARWARVEGMPIDSYESALVWCRDNKGIAA